MKSVEADNEELKGVLPKTYTKIDNAIFVSLLKNFSQIAVDADGDKFGKIYEYFLGNFARAEGQRGGEFFTLTTTVQLIVEIIDPHHEAINGPLVWFLRYVRPECQVHQILFNGEPQAQANFREFMFGRSGIIRQSF